MTDTIGYYNANAAAFAAGTVGVDMTDLRRRFTELLPAGSHVLDLGCGSGRDSLAFLQQGFSVTAVDGSRELCRLAAELTGLPVRCVPFAGLDYRSEFEGVWACASLLHVEKNSMAGVLRLTAEALKPGGVLYVSYKYGAEQRSVEGRLFSDYTERDLPVLFPSEGHLICREWWVTEDARPDRAGERWLNILCRKV